MTVNLSPMAPMIAAEGAITLQTPSKYIDMAKELAPEHLKLDRYRKIKPSENSLSDDELRKQLLIVYEHAGTECTYRISFGDTDFNVKRRNITLEKEKLTTGGLANAGWDKVDAEDARLIGIAALYHLADQISDLENEKLLKLGAQATTKDFAKLLENTPTEIRH